MRNLKCAFLLLAFTSQLCVVVLCESIESTTISESNLVKNEMSDNVTVTQQQKLPLLSTGNELWDGLIRDCLKKPTFSCIQKNVFTYLETAMGLKDVNITNRVHLTRNNVEYELPEQPKDEENEIFFEGRATPIEEVSTALYEKGVKFLVTHDMNMQLPEFMFDGATFRISPRSIEGNGIVAKLEYIPKVDTEVEARSEDLARLFKKKIKKFFKKKIVLAIIAVILIIKIIKIKVFWLLPLLVGVGTAKKLVLKFLLFLFPALSHVFKLCGFYHANFPKTNYHHHKHHINHLHTVLYDGEGHTGASSSGHGYDSATHDYFNKYMHSKPPKGHVSEYLHGAPVPPHLSFQPNPSDDDWSLSGPSLGSEFISDRSGYEGAHPFNKQPMPSHSVNLNPLTHFKNRPYYKRRTYGAPTTQLQRQPTGTAYASASQYNPQYASPPIVDDNLIKQRQEALRIQKEQQLISKQQSILHSQPFVQDVEPLTPKPIDPFYSPILLKLDNIFHQMGYNDEPCKERIVCNMYKEPTKYSPHSNYVSSELSRDSNELQRPAQSNSAVLRFYRYVQAARDGQDQKDCSINYPCNLPTKKK
ncbi:hypothetical protein PVAND_003054 [Polypedilum vanderplanki]|uniref:Uncharacterized protein n=1 Tax=Polypedilum vanderplanki TaxID=319348 RepID=A0A9J6BTD4_POLVA|nr:hypothetical protein PVAND_003054 [Polypedilum vanderplanki]